MTTYSTSLKLTLIGDGQEAGTWGQTTNTNLGTLLEQAITGYIAINMADANVTLTTLNGAIDQARNAVIELTGTNSAIRDVIPPVVKKLYTIVNSTIGGFAIRVIGATGTGVNVPNGATVLVYCNGTNFVSGLSGVPNNFSVAGNLTATANVTANNAIITANLSTSNLAATGNATISGNVTALSFAGSGAGLTTLNASNLSSGTVALGRLGSSGTANTSTFLRGDNSWSTITSLVTANFTIEESGGKLVFKYGGANVATLDSSGTFTAVTLTADAV